MSDTNTNGDTRTVLHRNTGYTSADFDLTLQLADGTRVAKRDGYWYRIEPTITSTEATCVVVTTPTLEPWKAAMLDMPQSSGTTEAAEPSDDNPNPSHHGCVEIQSVSGDEVSVDDPTTISKLGASYYNNRTKYGTGMDTVLQALKNGIVVKEE